MNDNRLGGLALILGAISGILTLTFHPGGGGGAHRVTPAQFEVLVAVIIGVHALALCGLPISFIGALALTRRIDSPLRLALFGLTIYGFGLVATMVAATMSGLVTPDILRKMTAHDSATDQWHTLMFYTHAINQAFARVHVIAFSVAISLWSLAILKRPGLPRMLAVYGIVAAVFVVIAIVSGTLNMELHGFRITTLIQALWFLFAGVFLWRSGTAEGGFAAPRAFAASA